MIVRFASSTRHPVQRHRVVVGVDRRAVAGERLALPVLGGLHGADDRQVEGLREVPVALVLGRHRHDRAGAVVGQHVVGGVDRDPLAVHRVGRVDAQEHAGLGAVGGQPLDVAGLAHLLQVRVVRRSLLVGDQVGGQRRVGRHHHERRAEQRVGPRGVDRDRLVPFDREGDVGALGPADPVPLGVDHALGPGRRQVVQVVQQLLGVVGDLEVPLGQLALGDLVAAALAAAVDDLLVGQHGLVEGAPVDRAVLAVGQATLTQLQEQPLGPAVVLGVGGVEGARPVEADAELLAGLRRDRDVLVGERRRVCVVADRGVLGVQAEGVEPHRVQDLVATLPPVAGDHVVQREDLGVPHVQVARGVGEHRQGVALLTRAAPSPRRRRPGRAAAPPRRAATSPAPRPRRTSRPRCPTCSSLIDLLSFVGRAPASSVEPVETCSRT